MRDDQSSLAKLCRELRRILKHLHLKTCKCRLAWTPEVHRQILASTPLHFQFLDPKAMEEGEKLSAVDGVDQRVKLRRAHSDNGCGSPYDALHGGQRVKIRGRQGRPALPCPLDLLGSVQLPGILCLRVQRHQLRPLYCEVLCNMVEQPARERQMVDTSKALAVDHLHFPEAQRPDKTGSEYHGHAGARPVGDDQIRRVCQDGEQAEPCCPESREDTRGVALPDFPGSGYPDNMSGLIPALHLEGLCLLLA
mmetsp:Transcript_50309/g.145907  ORF Transcript_50309/g.145907 Transcript_50309/m.145907 type:complete len:251 (-) Transcript_50309:297-1049(-)